MEVESLVSAPSREKTAPQMGYTSSTPVVLKCCMRTKNQDYTLSTPTGRPTVRTWRFFSGDQEPFLWGCGRSPGINDPRQSPQGRHFIFTGARTHAPC